MSVQYYHRVMAVKLSQWPAEVLLELGGNTIKSIMSVPQAKYRQDDLLQTIFQTFFGFCSLHFIVFLALEETSKWGCHRTVKLWILVPSELHSDGYGDFRKEKHHLLYTASFRNLIKQKTGLLHSHLPNAMFCILRTSNLKRIWKMHSNLNSMLYYFLKAQWPINENWRFASVPPRIISTPLFTKCHKWDFWKDLLLYKKQMAWDSSKKITYDWFYALQFLIASTIPSPS